MPILELEPTSYPADLLESRVSVQGCAATQERSWAVVQTKSRQEKALARELYGGQIPFYLPLTRQENVLRGRVRYSFMPVLSGYMFMHVSPDERLRALRTNRIARILPVGDEGQLESELRNLASLIATGVPLTVEKQLQAGHRVRVKQGVLEGLEGIIIQRRGTNRLLVAVTYLQQGVSVEINDFMVERCG